MQIASLFLLATVVPALAAFHTEQADGSLKVMDGDKLVTEYRTDARTPYLYPLVSPDGAVLSRHWPIEEGVEGEEHDHPHHRSFWLSHGSVDGFDFWAWTGKGDPHIEHKGFSDVKSTDSSTTFTVDLEWTADGVLRVREKRTYKVRKTDKETFEIEVRTKLEAAKDEVVFGDTKEGFCAIRVDRSLRLKGPQAKGAIVDSEARTGEDCWGKRANWEAFSGPDEKGQPVVIAMMDHPSNLRHPTWWHARDYGLLAANPFGHHDFEAKKAEPTLGNYTLKKDKPLAFRYLVVIHQGSVASAKLCDHWTQFAN